MFLQLVLHRFLTGRHRTCFVCFKDFVLLVFWGMLGGSGFELWVFLDTCGTSLRCVWRFVFCTCQERLSTRLTLFLSVFPTATPFPRSDSTRPRCRIPTFSCTFRHVRMVSYIIPTCLLYLPIFAPCVPICFLHVPTCFVSTEQSLVGAYASWASSGGPTLLGVGGGPAPVGGGVLLGFSYCFPSPPPTSKPPMPPPPTRSSHLMAPRLWIAPRRWVIQSTRKSR